MEGKSLAQESSESNDDEDTKDEGDKDEDDELETQSRSRTLSLYVIFQESSEENDEDSKDEGDQEEDDELETRSVSRTLSLHVTFQQSRLRETSSYLTECEEKLPKNTKMAAKFNQFQIRAKLQNVITNFMNLKLQGKKELVKNESK